MSYLDRILACNRHDLAHFIPFRLGRQTVGWVLPGFADRLRAWPSVFRVSADGVQLHPDLDDYDSRSRAVGEVVAALAAQGVIQGWRGENYPVAADDREAALFEIERAAVPYFGFRAWGVHVNGLVRRHDGLYVWVGQRAVDKPTFPGMLDHLAAGGQPVGIGLLANVIKECGEEAGVPPDLAAQASHVQTLHYCCETRSGLKPDTIHVFDLYLPDDFVPRNVDGEVERFQLWSLDEVADVVANTERFKPNCNLVLIDLLLRQHHPSITADGSMKIRDTLYATPACMSAV